MKYVGGEGCGESVQCARQDDDRAILGDNEEGGTVTLAVAV